MSADQPSEGTARWLPATEMLEITGRESRQASDSDGRRHRRRTLRGWRTGATRPRHPGPSAASGGAAGVEAPRAPQVRHGRGAPPEPVEQEPQVVVGIREIGIGRDRPLVGLDRRGGAARVLEQPAEIEVRDRVVGSVAEGGPVVRLRGRGLAGRVEEAPEVDVRVGQLRIDRQRLLVGVPRLGGRGRLELAAQIEPLLRGPGGLGGRGGGGLRGRRRRGGRERGSVEREQELAGVRLPARGAVPGHHATAVRVDADAR